MQIVFLSDNMKFSGGRKVLFEYAAYLKEKGHDVNVFVLTKKGELSHLVDAEVVEDFSRNSIPDCDIIVASKPYEVLQARNSGRGKVVHFCQGFEISDLEQRIDGKVLPERYKGKGILKSFRRWRKKRDWMKRIRDYDSIYSLPDTHLVTISKHLKEELDRRYSKNACFFAFGVHQQFFYPSENIDFKTFSKDNPLKVINIGPSEVTFKGIDTTVGAIEILKEKGLPVEFIRVTPGISATDKVFENAVDRIYENMSQKELGELIRSCDVYISNSTEGEGFGLPALEALSCGVICVLSSISSYLNFSEKRDFCYFVPEGDAASTAASVEKILKAPAGELESMRKNTLEVASGFSYSKGCESFERILSDFV